MEWHSRFAVVGAEVAVISESGKTVIRKVDRIISDRVFLDNGALFYRDTGIKVGWQSGGVTMLPATQKHKDDAERCAIVGRLFATKWQDVGLDVLRKIDGCLG